MLFINAFHLLCVSDHRAASLTAQHQGRVSSSSSSSSSVPSSASHDKLSKELSDAVERLRAILPADAVRLQHRDSFGLLDLLSSQSLSDSETAEAAELLAARDQAKKLLVAKHQAAKLQQPQPEMQGDSTREVPPVAGQEHISSGAA